MVDAHVKCLIVVTEDERNVTGVRRTGTVGIAVTDHAAVRGRRSGTSRGIHTADLALIREDGMVEVVNVRIRIVPCLLVAGTSVPETTRHHADV